MSTVRKETEEARDKQEARDKGGVTQEDRSKTMEGAESTPFDGAQAKPKRKE